LDKWCIDIYDYKTELYKQIKETEEINNRISSTSLNLTYKTHSEAIYCIQVDLILKIFQYKI